MSEHESRGSGFFGDLSEETPRAQRWALVTFIAGVVSFVIAAIARNGNENVFLTAAAVGILLFAATLVLIVVGSATDKTQI